MKTGYIQIFDKEGDAVTALGRISGIFPDYNHDLLKKCNQVQIWKTIGGETSSDIVGELNDEIVYVVTSMPPN